jgi:hypothetical protein
MREFNFIKDQLIKKHNVINSIEYLNRYINFIIDYQLNESDIYTEKHHILPRSTFPEYEKESWNIVELSYEDHRLIPIRL